MKKKRHFLLILSFPVILSCSIQNMDTTEGMIWQKDLPLPPAAGIEIYSNNLFFADSGGTLYSCWIDTGRINWKRTLSRERAIMLFAMKSGLGVISTGRERQGSLFRIYSYDRGIIGYETNLSIKPRDYYSTDGTNILVHSGNAAVIIGDKYGEIRLADFSRYSDNIVTFAKWGGYFYIIDNRSDIFRFDGHMNPAGPGLRLGGKFDGNAAYYDDRIFLSASDGLKIVNTDSWSPENADQDFKNGTPPVIFGGSLGLKNRRKALKYYIFSDLSFKTADENSYTPLIMSGTIGVAAFIDSKGFLEVIDSSTGRYVGSKFVGTIDRPFMKTAIDYGAKSIFLPVSSPAKIFCYSINFAASQKMPR